MLVCYKKHELIFMYGFIPLYVTQPVHLNVTGRAYLEETCFL